MAKDMELLWKSPNKKWEIYDDNASMKFKTDWNDPYSTVAQIYVTDGWFSFYGSIDVKGDAGFGLYGTGVPPKTIAEKGKAILRKMYLEKKATVGKKKALPIRYFVCTWSNRRDKTGRQMDPQANTKYFTHYEPAKKYAKLLWSKMTSTQKEYMYVTIGRFDDKYESVKEIPKTYRYTHAGEISKNNPPKWL